MFEDNLIEYYNSIEPSNELIERTVIMSKNEKKKNIKLPKRAIAILIAAIITAIGITGYAATIRIRNNDKGIANEYETGIVFDFTKADNTPKSLSSSANDIIIALNDLGYDKVLLPTELLDNTKIEHIDPFITDNSNIISLESNKYKDIELDIVDKVKREDMNNFWGTGDENTIGEIKQINDIDVCLTIQGSDDIGYMAYVNYVVNDAVYCIKFFGGSDKINAYNSGIEFINSLEQ